MSWEDLPTNYTDAEYSGLRKYTMIENEDNTVSFEDVTEYENEETSYYRAADANKANEAINTLMNNSSSDVVNNGLCQGRLTLISGHPIPETDTSTAETLYFTPYKGNLISLYSSGSWAVYTLTELSLSLTNLSNTVPLDIFVYEDNDILSLVSVPWASMSARGTALSVVDGIRVLSTDYTKRYVGTICLNDDGYGEDSITGRLLYNEYNQVSRPILKQLDATGTAEIHINSWVPYFDDYAPVVRILVPNVDTEFELSGVGMGTSVTDTDMDSYRAQAIGIGCDRTDVNCAPIGSQSYGNMAVRVEIQNFWSSFIGCHTYTLLWWTNWNSFRPGALTFYDSLGLYPGLFGYIEA